MGKTESTVRTRKSELKNRFTKKEVSKDGLTSHLRVQPIKNGKGGTTLRRMTSKKMARGNLISSESREG